MKQLSILLSMFLLASACSLFQKKVISKDSPIIFDKTELKKAVKYIQKGKPDELSFFFEEHPDLLDYQEKRFKQTILHWAVRRNYTSACHTLLTEGADPNLQARDGTYPIMHAARLEESALLKMLLQFEADPKVTSKTEGVDNFQELRTPLIAACMSNLNNVRVIIKAGVDINYTETKFKMQNALTAAFNARKMDIVRYLIIDQKINLENIEHVSTKGDSIEVRTYLRELAFPLDSDEYQLKMEVVQYLKAQRINYWDYPIPKRMFHNFSTRYLKNY